MIAYYYFAYHAFLHSVHNFPTVTENGFWDVFCVNKMHSSFPIIQLNVGRICLRVLVILLREKKR